MSATQAEAVAAGNSARFRDLYRDTQAQLFRRNLLVAASIYMSFVTWDLIVAPMRARSILNVRLLLLGVGTLLFLGSRLSSFRRWYNWYYVALIGLVGLSIAVILRFVPQGFAIGIGGVLLTISASSVIFRASGWVIAIAGGACCWEPLRSWRFTENRAISSEGTPSSWSSRLVSPCSTASRRNAAPSRCSKRRDAWSAKRR